MSSARGGSVPSLAVLAKGDEPVRALADLGVQAHGAISPAHVVNLLLERMADAVLLGPDTEADVGAQLTQALRRRFPEVPVFRSAVASAEVDASSGGPPGVGKGPSVPWPLPPREQLHDILSQQVTGQVPRPVFEALTTLGEMSELEPALTRLEEERRRLSRSVGSSASLLSSASSAADRSTSSAANRSTSFSLEGLDEDTLPVDDLRATEEGASSSEALTVAHAMFEPLPWEPPPPEGLPPATIEPDTLPWQALASTTLPEPEAVSTTDAGAGRSKLGPSIASRVRSIIRVLEAATHEEEAAALSALLVDPADSDEPERAVAMAARLAPSPRVLVLAPSLADLSNVAAWVLARGCRLELVAAADVALRAVERTDFDLVLAAPGPQAARFVVEVPWLERTSSAVTVLLGAPPGVDAEALEREDVVLLDVASNETTLEEVLGPLLGRAGTRDSEGFLEFVQKPEPGAVVIGPLGLIDLRELLLALRMSGRTALVEVFVTAGRAGTLMVKDGQPIAAEAGNIVGPAAKEKLHEVQTGWFRVCLDQELDVPQNL